MDVSGRQLLLKDISAVEGENTSTVDVSHLAGGMYLIRLINHDDVIQTARVMISRVK